MRDLALDAYNAAYIEGDYGSAVLRSATAAEVLLRNSSALLAWEANMTRTPATHGSASLSIAMSPNAPPVRLIAEVLLPELGGEWDARAPGTAAGDWKIRIAHIRNRVVHTGYSPSRGEARSAVESLNLLIMHLEDRLVASAQKYPRSALILVGRRELERRGVWAKVRATAAGGPGTERWLLDFGEWIETHVNK